MRRIGVTLALLLAWAGAAFGAQATLSWTDVATNERGYYVERKTEACAGTGNAWSRIAAPGVNATGYVDQTVQPSVTYCYRVQAWNTTQADGTGAIQVSGWSNLAGITIAAEVTKPGPPTAVAVVPGSEQCSTAACSWQVTWREPATTNLLRTTLYTMVQGTTTPQKVEVPASSGTGGGTVTTRSVAMPAPIGQVTVIEMWITATNSAGEGEAQGLAPITKDRTGEQPVPAIPTGLTIQ